MPEMDENWSLKPPATDDRSGGPIVRREICDLARRPPVQSPGREERFDLANCPLTVGGFSFGRSKIHA